MNNTSLTPVPRNEWMIVYSTYDLSDAHVVAGRLEVEGIRAFVYRQPGAGALGIMVGTLGEITVLVHPAQYESALLLLEPDDALDELPESTDDVIYRWDDEDADDDQ